MEGGYSEALIESNFFSWKNNVGQKPNSKYLGVITPVHPSYQFIFGHLWGLAP